MPKSKSFSKRNILFIIFIWGVILNFLTPFRGDDFGYQLLSGDGNERISNLYEIIVFQAEEYIRTGGRVIVHTIVQIFLNILGKPAFNIFNSIFLVLYFYILSKIAAQKTTSYTMLTISIPLFIFLMPCIDETIFWICGAVNYLWSVTACLAFIYCFFNKQRVDRIAADDGIYRFCYPILCFIAGCSQDGIVIGVGAAVALYLIINFRKLSTYHLVSASAFILGSIVLVLAPGNFARLENMNSNQIISISVETTGIAGIMLYIKKLLVNLTGLRISIILLVSLTALLLSRHGRFIRFIKENIYMFTIVAAQYGFIAFCGHVSYRGLFGIETISLILLMRLMQQYMLNTIHNRRAMLYLNACVVALLFVVTFFSYDNLTRSHHAIRELENGNNVIAQTPKYGILNKYILGIAEQQDKQHQPVYWENIQISRYYDLPYIVMLPDELINCKNMDSFTTLADGCYTMPDWSFFIKKASPGVVSGELYNVCINFSEIAPHQIPLIKRMIKPLLNPNRSSTHVEINNGAYTIEIASESYYIINKPEVNDLYRRFKGIDIVTE